MDKVFYCKKWSVGYKESMNPLSENEAKKSILAGCRILHLSVLM